MKKMKGSQITIIAISLCCVAAIVLAVGIVGTIGVVYLLNGDNSKEARVERDVKATLDAMLNRSESEEMYASGSITISDNEMGKTITDHIEYSIDRINLHDGKESVDIRIISPNIYQILEQVTDFTFTASNRDALFEAVSEQLNYTYPIKDFTIQCGIEYKNGHWYLETNEKLLNSLSGNLYQYYLTSGEYTGSNALLSGAYSLDLERLIIECLTWTGNELGKTEVELKALAEEYGFVSAWEFADYDGDGSSEAFAVITDADYAILKTLFISMDGTVTVMEENLGRSLYKSNEGYIRSTNGKSFFWADMGAYGSGWQTLLYSVKNGEPYILKLSGTIQGFYQSGDILYTTENEYPPGGGHLYPKVELVYDSSAQEFSKGKRVELSSSSSAEESTTDDQASVIEITAFYHFNFCEFAQLFGMQTTEGPGGCGAVGAAEYLYRRGTWYTFHTISLHTSSERKLEPGLFETSTVSEKYSIHGLRVGMTASECFAQMEKAGFQIDNSETWNVDASHYYYAYNDAGERIETNIYGDVCDGLTYWPAGYYN